MHTIKSEEFNPLNSISVPNVSRMKPRGLIVVIGPNSAGKTQMLKDIQARVLGIPRNLVVCEDIEIIRPEYQSLLDTLYSKGHIKRRTDTNNNVFIDFLLPHLASDADPGSSLQEGVLSNYFRNVPTVQGVQADKFLEHFGRFFVSSLFLTRRLNLTNAVASFDYETASPTNELQALHLNPTAKQALFAEAVKVFGKAIWLDITRHGLLCLRVAANGKMPSAEDRLEPEKMQQYRLIEDEGDGFKSYVGICLTLLLGQRPICLLDEPEMCLHPPQAYALGQFIGKYGVSADHVTFVATHSSHVLRGIIEQTKQIEIIRLSRAGSSFSGKKVVQDTIRACIQKPSTKIETILDGLFAEAVTIVESEGDRLVYSTTWEKIANEFRHDVHFVSVGGLGGIADTCRLYRNLEIPVCVITDLDVIRELDTFGCIVRSLVLPEQATEVIEKCKQILTQVIALGPIFNEEETCSKLKMITEKALDWSNREHLKEVRNILSTLSAGLSPTARLKSGVESVILQTVSHDQKALLATCRSFGLFLVEVGELEDWVPDLMKDGPSRQKKAEWANAAANMIREAPVEDGNIWGFIRKMARCQEGEAARLSGYAF